MDIRKLGATGLKISAIGLGCWQFSGGRGLTGGYWQGLDASTTRDIVQASLDGDITFFDTAEAYGSGVSERTLAASLASCSAEDSRVVVASKWMPVLRFAGSIERTIDRRIAALKPFGIDLYQIHNPAGFSSIENEMSRMANLLSRGFIRSVGVSNFSTRQMREAHSALARFGIPLASNQIRYNLIDRKPEQNGVLETARELGVTIIAYSPLSQGILTGKYHRDPALVRSLKGPRKLLPRFRRLETTKHVIDRLFAIADRHGVTPAQVALNWTVRRHDHVVAIPGASSVSQAKSNADALGFSLSSDEIDELSSNGGGNHTGTSN